MVRIGIDIGGTFTDFVIFDPGTGQITTFKLPSDAENPALSVLKGLEYLLDQPLQVIHGSTVATNALLERKGARTALVTTRGFKDVLQIGRQNRPRLYDLSVELPPPLVPAELRFELEERVDYQGNVLKVLDPAQVEELSPLLSRNQVESVAVCFLFSFLYPQHEQLVAQALRRTGFVTSVSSEILPEFREYERTSTTVVNAYVSPILGKYLSSLETSLPNARLQIMQSNGGMISVDQARANGARCILSGPAGGVVAAQNIAQRTVQSNPTLFPDPTLKLITFDMGGTSTDVSLIDGEPTLTTDSSVGDCPIHLPMLDIHTIGAGGGSIAYVDAGGSLRVGPHSAGADPGPACYGRGELPTVTDANLVLGRLLPDHFLGGKMTIDPERALSALRGLGIQLGLSAIQAAYGVIEVVNAQMEHALRVISVERGHDPRDYCLFSFGGAGGLHASQLARRVGIPRIIIPKFASTCSAYGMLASNVVKDYVKTVMLPGSTPVVMLDELYAPLISQAEREIAAEGIPGDQIELHPSLDVRFSGQSYELNVPYSEHFIEDFHHAHRLSYGYTYEYKPLELVNLRLRGTGKIQPISLPVAQPDFSAVPPNPLKYSEIELNGAQHELPIFDYEQLLPGAKFDGPALIVSTDTTILVDSHDSVYVDAYQNLLITVGKEG